MTYHPHDDLPDPETPPSVPGHDLVRWISLPREYDPPQPAESSIACTCGHEAESQENAGGGAESCADLWNEHLEEVAA